MRKTLIHLVCLVVILCTTHQVQAELVAHYTLDETTGTTAADASGNGNDGNITGNAQWVAGFYGGAFSFDGATFITLPAAQMGLTADIGSVALWMRIGTDLTVPNNINTIFWAGDNDTGGGFGPENEIHLHLESAVDNIWVGGELSFRTPSQFIQSDPLKGAFGSSPVDPVLLTDDQWHHVAATWGDGFIRLYLDGALLNEDVSSDGGWDFTNIYLGQMAAGNRQYTGLLDDVRIFDHVLTEEEVNSALNASPPELGAAPRPENEATDVARDGLILAWTPGKFAATHDVYFGSSMQDVNDANRENSLDVLISENQSGTTYALGRLDLGQTYYWRIDEVNAGPDMTIFKGLIWQFTVEPHSYPIDASSITATASSAKDDTSVAEKTIDGSGIDENDGHSTTPSDMWLSASGDQSPSIQYEFDRIYKLDKALVWNSNQRAEGVIGYGVKDVQIETSIDGNTWNIVEGVSQLTKAPGQEGTAPTDSVDLTGVVAKYVRFNITSNWGGILTQYSLSEVRFYYIPLNARLPVPASGSTDVPPDTVLGWRAGREAGVHEVYLSTDANAVLDGSAPSESVTDNSLGLASLDLPLDDTYFWKVNEVNDTQDPSIWEGTLWNFTVPSYLVVEDFEGYNNFSPDRPFQTWIDGLGFSEDEFLTANPGNNTGAAVGHDIWSLGSPHFDGDIMEQILVYGGDQSLPLYYNNSGSGGKLTHSEMTRTFAAGQNWTLHGITTLVLFFRGVEGNTGQLYVKINDTKVLYMDEAGALSRQLWKQWNIDLSSVGADVANVQSLTVGIEDAGSGLVYIDEIRLYRNAPPIPEPVDPGIAGLIASYSMEGNVNDGSGQGRDGTAIGNPGFDQGPSGFGLALAFDGIEDHVELPIGPIIASLTDFTFAGWVNYANSEGLWQRVFDFGQSVEDANNNPSDYMFLTPSSLGGGPMRFAILATGSAGESLVDGTSELPTGWHHVAVTIDSSTMTLTLYMDGTIVGRASTELLPQDLGETDQNWLGRSQWANDAFFEGLLDELLLYDRALSEGEIRYLVGEQ